MERFKKVRHGRFKMGLPIISPFAMRHILFLDTAYKIIAGELTQTYIL